jgi:putative ABC transport system ATP-binding protein
MADIFSAVNASSTLEGSKSRGYSTGKIPPVPSTSAPVSQQVVPPANSPSVDDLTRLANAPVVIDVQNLRKSYGRGESKFDALKGVSLQIKQGESVAIVGKSGSGKSTLMHLIALLDKPSGGDIIIGGKSSRKLKGKNLNRLRNHTFGFVFQQFFMNGNDTVLNNVLLPLKIGKMSGRKRKRAAIGALEAVELGEKRRNKAKNLSGGQKQRVCIARAIVNHPKILFADEPTGNLDSETSELIENLLFGLHREHDITLIVVTHDPDLAAKCDRQILLKDGLIIPTPANTTLVAQKSASTPISATPQDAQPETPPQLSTQVQGDPSATVVLPKIKQDSGLVLAPSASSSVTNPINMSQNSTVNDPLFAGAQDDLNAIKNMTSQMNNLSKLTAKSDEQSVSVTQPSYSEFPQQTYTPVGQDPSYGLSLNEYRSQNPQFQSAPQSLSANPYDGLLYEQQYQQSPQQNYGQNYDSGYSQSYDQKFSGQQYPQTQYDQYSVDSSQYDQYGQQQIMQPQYQDISWQRQQNNGQYVQPYSGQTQNNGEQYNPNQNSQSNYYGGQY